jgi:TrmH family RNA methyltransferase
VRGVKEIRSRDNPRYKALQRLVQSSQERRRMGLSVLDGTHLVAAYCEHVGQPEHVIVNRAGLANPEVQAILETSGLAAPTVLGDALFREVSSVATPTGIIAVVKTPPPGPVPAGIDACVMLEALQDPGNLGSILRSCAAAGVQHVFLSRGSVHAWSPRVLRAGMGAHFSLCVHERVDLLAAAHGFKGKVIATCGGARHSLYDADLRGNVALVFGNEGSGLSPALRAAAHVEISIPMPGATESLNVAAAVAVCLFERIRQLAAAPNAR